MLLNPLHTPGWRALTLAFTFLLAGPILEGRAEETSGQRTHLESSLRYLASDELGGRGVGTEGINQAADYLAAQLASMGLKTDMFQGQAYQKFEITTDSVLGPAEENRLAFVKTDAAEGPQGGRVALELGQSFNTLAIGGSGQLDAPLVFVGYGVTAENFGYNDFAGLDVKGKAILVLRKEPQQNDANSKFNGVKPSRHAFFNTKMDNARQFGAAAVIFVNDQYGIEQTKADRQKQWDEKVDQLVDLRSKHAAIETPSPEQAAEHRQAVEKVVDALYSLKQQQQTDPDVMLDLNGAGPNDGRAKMPVFFARRAVVDEVVKAALGESLAALENKIDEGPTPHSGELAGWRVECQSSVKEVRTEVKNVVAVLEGEGPIADETVIVGAHYDHLGNGGAGSLAPWTKEIHNGADDNASGTAALLEVARSLTQNPPQPRRRLVFIAFSAEERGLLGSQHYVDHPLFALENTVAMVNLDMVGRLTNNKLLVSGTGTAVEFDSLLDRFNEKYQFELSKDPGGFGPSDHATFYRRKIPVFHFFTGTHPDYHRPSDDADKINFDGMQRIAGMVAEITRELATAETRPVYQTDPRLPAGMPSHPVLGVVPDSDRQVQGMALAEVAADGPAAKAGLQAGDVIIKIGELKVTNLPDVQAILTKHKAGDEVKVVVQRDGTEMEFTVKLAPPR